MAKGAKTSGYIELKANDKLYFYVGGKGSNTNTNCRTSGYEFNGGGIAKQLSSSVCGVSGGGATDVRLVSGSWDNASSLISRIMVAGGGGCATGSSQYTKGNGGTLYGATPIFSTYQQNIGKGGTQTSGGATPTKYSGATSNGTAGSFGKGGLGGASASSATFGGGSGASGLSSGTWPGGGGSSYISGYAGVNSVEESTTITHTNQTLHYSGKYFVSGQMTEGQNSGNGYAKISYVDSKPKRKNTQLNDVRYIKNCIKRNSKNDWNAWIEIQAIKNGANIAKGKTASGVTAHSAEGGPITNVTDGIIDYSNYINTSSGSSNTTECITIDLGQTYDLDELAVWNYFGDQRSYYDNVTSVSSDNSTWKTVINDSSVESSNGHRVNAYTDTLNGYTSDGLVLWYDGYANTGATRNHTSTTWKNLANSSYTGTLTGGTWNSDYLYLDGTDDWVKIAALNLNTPTVEVVFKKPTSVTSEQVLIGNFNSGGYGLTSINEELAGEFYIDGSYSLLYKSLELNVKEVLSTSYNKTIMKLYSNGSVYSTKSVSGTIGAPTNSTVMAIGANPNGLSVSGGYFKGNIYSVRIYNKALTDSEIKNNYLYDKQRFNLE